MRNGSMNFSEQESVRLTETANLLLQTLVTTGSAAARGNPIQSCVPCKWKKKEKSAAGRLPLSEEDRCVGMLHDILAEIRTTTTQPTAERRQGRLHA